MSNQASLGDISTKESDGQEKDRGESATEKYDPVRIERDEFGNLPENWHYVPIDKLKDYVESGCSESQNKEGKGLPVSRIETIADGIVNYDKVGYVPEDIIDAEKYRLENGDLIFSNINSREEIGKTAIYEEREPLYHGMNVLRIGLNSEMNDYFGYYVFDSEMGYRIFFRNSQAAVGQSSINQGQLKSINLPLPPKPEQRRIASVLYNVDQAIQKTEEIIEQTQRVKKGLMQDLFTEGYFEHEEFEDTGFGKKPSEWRSEKLSSIGSFKNGLDFSGEQKGDGTKIANVPNVYGSIFIHPDELDRVNITDKEIRKFSLKPDDIILVRSSKKKEGVGQAAIFTGSEEEVVFAGFTIRFRPTADKIDPKFLAHYLRYPRMRKRVVSIAGENALTNVSQSDYRRLEVPIPSIEEQKKIVESLDLFDRWLRKFELERRGLKRLKKGLMQDLLTGEVRTSESVEVLDEVREVES